VCQAFYCHRKSLIVWAAHEDILRKHKNRWFVVQNGAGGVKIDYATAKSGAVLSQVSH
jgi:hypothetical protein